MRMVCKWLCLTAAAMLWPLAAQAEDRFTFSEEDLPEAQIGEYRVAFTRNGAFAVSRQDRWLFDGGLGYMTTAWAEWGTQVRRSDEKDGWESLDGGRVMFTHGTLFDVSRKPRFRFEQRTSLVAGGLHFEYRITRLAEKLSIAGMGLMVHMPVPVARRGKVAFWPGFQQVSVPEERGAVGLASGERRACVLAFSQEPPIAFVGSEPLLWALYDDRPWNVNCFRLVARDPNATAALNGGETAVFAFDLLLADGVAASAILGPLQCTLDRYGRFAGDMEGATIIEGGIGPVGATAVERLFDTQPAHAVAAEPGGGSVTGTAPGCDKYVISMRQGADAVTLKYQIAPTKAGSGAVEFLPKFTVPLTPDLRIVNTATGERIVADATARPLASTFALEIGDTRKVVVQSTGRWSVLQSTLAGKPALLLTAEPAGAQGGNGIEMTINLSESAQKQEKQP